MAAANMVGKAFGEGVKAALKFFQNPQNMKNLAKGAEQVMKALQKARR